MGRGDGLLPLRYLLLLAAGIAFLGGIAVTLVVTRYLARRRAEASPPPEPPKVTRLWSLDEVIGEGEAPPRMVADAPHLEDLPPGTRLLVRRGTPVHPTLLKRCETRMHPGPLPSACIGAKRALLFSGTPREGALAVATSDPLTLDRLRSEFRQLWRDGEPYRLRLHAHDLPHHVGHLVEVQGIVMDASTHEGRPLFRVSEEGHPMGVLAPVGTDPALTGSAVRAVGVVAKEDGIVYVDATLVERARLERRSPPR